jgi:hypothetical protein
MEGNLKKIIEDDIQKNQIEDYHKRRIKSKMTSKKNRTNFNQQHRKPNQHNSQIYIGTIKKNQPYFAVT